MCGLICAEDSARIFPGKLKTEAKVNDKSHQRKNVIGQEDGTEFDHFTQLIVYHRGFGRCGDVPADLPVVLLVNYHRKLLQTRKTEKVRTTPLPSNDCKTASLKIAFHW